VSAVGAVSRTGTRPHDRRGMPNPYGRSGESRQQQIHSVSLTLRCPRTSRQRNSLASPISPARGRGYRSLAGDCRFLVRARPSARSENGSSELIPHRDRKPRERSRRIRTKRTCQRAPALVVSAASGPCGPGSSHPGQRATDNPVPATARRRCNRSKAAPNPSLTVLQLQCHSALVVPPSPSLQTTLRAPDAAAVALARHLDVAPAPARGLFPVTMATGFERSHRSAAQTVAHPSPPRGLPR
jgi:hypothetical protein